MSELRPSGASDADLTLARLLVEQGMVSEARVSECLAELEQMARSGAPSLPKLGELLARRGYLTPQHLQQTVKQETPESRPTKIRVAEVPPEVAHAPPQARFGKYVRTAKLGAGGMGEVWKAWDTELSRWVALKFLKGEDGDEIARFKQEARLAGQLTHPNIAAIYDVGQDRERHYIAMQFVDGRSLHGYPRDNLRTLARILRDAARGVHFAHEQGIVHRDLKPENLMIATRSGEEPHVYVMDFGLARQTAGASNLSVSGYVMGTPAYMPPEQARGEKVDARADVYSLGATLYEMVSGRPPFEAPAVLEILRKAVEEDAPLLEGELGTIAAKAMEKDRERRYASAAELAEDLDRWLAGEPIHARRASILYRTRKRLAKRKALVAALAGGIGLAIALLVYFAPRLARAQRFAAAYDIAVVRVNEFGLAAATMSERRDARAAEAVRALEAAIEIDDRQPMAWVWLGRCRRALGDEASSCWERALAVEPTHAEALLERCSQRLEAYQKSRGESEAGYASYRQLVSYRPLRSESAEEKALRVSAEADLQAARQSGLRGHLSAYLEGLSAFGRADYAAAEKGLGEYLEQVPWDAAARLVRARARRYQRKYEAGEKDCRQLIEFQPRNLGAHLLLGLMFRDRHQPEEALKIFTQAKALDPENYHVLYNLGNILADLNRMDEAQSLYTDVVRKNPLYAPAWSAHAWMNQCKGELAKAEADYDHALSLDPTEGRSYIRRAYLYQQQNRQADALRDYTRGIELDGTDPAAFNNRAHIYLELGRMDEAEADFTKAIELDDDFWSAHYERARLLHRKGKNGEAERDVSRAIALKPDESVAWRLRADLRDRLGLWKESLADWRKAFELEKVPYDYGRLWVWILRSRLGEREEATRELRDYVRAKKLEDPWFDAVVRLLIGDLPEAEFLKAAALPDPKLDRERKCEAYYYAGIRRFLDGDGAGSRALLEQCVATGVTEFAEYQGAAAQLRRMPKN